MQKAISYWAMPGGLAGSCPLDTALSLSKNAGFPALELCIGLEGILTPQSSQADCQRYRQLIDASGVTVETLASGLSWAFCPTDNDAGIRRKAIEIHKQCLQRTAWLGCQAMLFVPGAVIIPWEKSFQPVRYDRALEWAREAVLELGRTASDLGVTLAVENVWNGLFYSPLEFRDFIDQIANPAVGVYFDLGNVLNHQQWPPHWIELLGPRIKRIHCKEFKLSVGTLDGFCDLLDGDMPWPEIMAALRKIGYQSTLTCEMMPYRDGLLEKTSQAMDKIIKM
jgi:L-ribulose-5-phosphate 3-epimerase